MSLTQRKNHDYQSIPRTRPIEMSERRIHVCCLAEAQASAQAFLRPAVWVPGLRNLHWVRETWKVNGSPVECMQLLAKGVEKIAEQENLQMRKMDEDRHFAQIFSFTSGCNWLDVVEIQFAEQEGNTIATAVSFSSGFLPAYCPFSFIWNCLLFWVPFSSNGFNSGRLTAIREAMHHDIIVTSKSTSPGA
ncbi:hypothetical protein EMCRGX_G026202 [Ephydatia muelleri]